MPGEIKKPLYIGSSMEDLNKKVDHNLTKGQTSRVYAKSAGKVLGEAEKAYREKDEERAYVLFMKYIALWQATRKARDYKQNKDFVDALLGTSGCSKAITMAEELSESLKSRYKELKEAEEVSKRIEEEKEKEKAATNGEKDGKKSGGMDTPTMNGDAEEISSEEKRVLGKAGLVTSIELYKELQSDPSSILLMDIRRSDHFRDSHITMGQVFNIPAEILKPGITAATLGKGLGQEAKALWDQRMEVEFIVLVDWEESMVPESNLAIVKDTMCKWDWQTAYKNDPLVLKGGYEDWLLKYPMYTSNPLAKKPAKKVEESKNLLDFEYPVFDDEKPPPPAPAAAPPSQPLPVNGTSAGNATNQPKPLQNGTGHPHPRMFFISGQPTVDRSIKPGAARTPGPQAKSAINSDSGRDVSRPATVSGVTPALPASGRDGSTMPPQGPSSNGGASTVAKPLATPTVNRNLKPKIDITGADSVDGKQERGDATDGKAPITEPGTKPVENSSVTPSHPPPPLAPESVEEDTKQAAHLEELKMKEEQARNDLNKMRYDKTKAENERLKEEKAEMERNLQKLQAQLAEAKAKKELKKQAAAAKPASPTHSTPPASPAIKPEDSQSSPSKRSATTSSSGDASSAPPASKVAENKSRPSPVLPKTQPNQNSNAAPADGKLASGASSGEVPTAEVTTTLPRGWEKRWDEKSKRYFYLNHNDNTSHWNPPPPGVPKPRDPEPRPASERSHPDSASSSLRQDGSSAPPKSSNTTPGQVRREPLKSESSEPSSKSSGLKRSLSSPNVAQMVMKEGDRSPFTMPVPTVDRSSKPIERPPQQITQFKSAYPNRVRNLNPIFGNQGRALTGLRNLGNTCFMNSVIQCLSNTTPLAKYFIMDNYLPHINRKNPLGRGGEVAEEFAIVVKAVWSGQYRSVAPRDLRDTVTKYVPEFRKHIGHHHDSQEFLLFLLDGLHEDLNQVTKREYVKEEDFSKYPDKKAASLSWENHERLNRSIIVSLFQGQFKSTVECLSCHNKSVKFEAFMYLSLPIPSNSKCTLNDCLVRFSQPEKLSGDNATHCSHCKTNRNSKKTILIWRLPKLLLIHLKRFYYEGMWRQKLQTYVDFPIAEFNLDRFVIGPERHGTYQLYGVSNHTGTLDGGHYTACCQNAVNKRWYKYDDHEVYDASQSAVKSSAAYILFYTSFNLSPP
ncbi:ubiquitin carboxyl-terminal hydrolase 8-like [Diadema antillarum]|uniref:ubiquitin carboxyl-terminal hydrolase 8-like n=1 Tax=Diadema antillarum TaxID=105358 RepID=UPI003A876174